MSFTATSPIKNGAWGLYHASRSLVRAVRASEIVESGSVDLQGICIIFTGRNK